MKKCDDPKVPIGMLPKGFGTIWFRLGKDGKPDTASISVLHAIGLSAAGVRSVAARQLSACRFDMGKPEPKDPTGVVSDITFADSAAELGVTTPSPTPGTPLPMEPQSIPKDSLPLVFGDRRVEERPRRLSCKGQPQQAPVLITGRGATPAQARQDAQDQARMAQMQHNATSGTLFAQFRVEIDGKPGSQVRVIEVSNPMATQSLADLIGGCRFAPGRIHGIAIPAYLQMWVP